MRGIRKKLHIIPRDASLELGCFAWAGTADFVLFRDDVVIEPTEPGGKSIINTDTQIFNTEVPII